MKRHFLFPLSILVCSACSGSQPGPGAEEDARLRNESSFCGEWAKAACNEDVVAACNGTRAECLATQKSACLVLVPPGYQAKYAQDCLDAVRNAYKDAELTAEELDVVLKLGGDCKRLIDGGSQEGDTCTSSFDCDGVNGFECIIKPGESDGTCQVPTEANGGDPCSDPEIVCADGYYCNGSDCLRLKAENAACAYDAMCEAELGCQIATGETEGTCEARLGNGQACTANDDCASSLCIGTTRKVCASNVVLTVESSLCDALR